MMEYRALFNFFSLQRNLHENQVFKFPRATETIREEKIRIKCVDLLMITMAANLTSMSRTRMVSIIVNQGMNMSRILK